ncbi:MAG: hypothetical protein COA50_03840 [Flavobacteriaceae bacterium]|nr:MAG: hypothetical protein COA50_03840 [Flavobacteriaceae bacterium]
MSFQISSWERVMFIIVAIFNLVYGTRLVINYSRNIRLDNLELGDGYLKVPIQGGNCHVIKLNDLKEIAVVDYPEHSIIFRCEKESHIIKKKWMSKRDFNELVDKLSNYTTSDETSYGKP